MTPEDEGDTEVLIDAFSPWTDGGLSVSVSPSVSQQPPVCLHSCRLGFTPSVPPAFLCSPPMCRLEFGVHPNVPPRVWCSPPCAS